MLADKISLKNLKKFLENPWASILKIRTNGMLPPKNYATLYAEAFDLPDLPFIDIGAAHGTTTIAVAKAFQVANKNAPVIAIEKFEGGSRRQFGGYAENFRIFTKQLEIYNVSDRVKVYDQYLDLSEETRNTLSRLVESDRISGFMHDADGHLHRDFRLFYNFVVPGGLIVIDDCPPHENEDELKRDGYGDKAKFLRTNRQWKMIKDKGLVENVYWLGDTAFARKAQDGKIDDDFVAELRKSID